MDTYLKNVDQNKKFLVKNGTIERAWSNDLEVQSYPASADTESDVITWEGVKGEFRITIDLVPSDADLSDGTGTGTVKTVKEQVSFLQDYFANRPGDTKQFYDDDFGTFNGEWNRIRIIKKAGQVNKYSCEITFKVGTVL